MSSARIGVPTLKQKKYDRQLRLWGANGQNRLQAAHIALFGASPTGYSLGKSRAERTAALLEELNPDVSGSFMDDSLSNLLSTKPEFFWPSTTPFTHIVVVSPFSTSDILQLSPEIPTFFVHTLGFITVLRIAAAPTRCVVETHPDSVIDLRILNPWEEISALASKQTKNLDMAEIDGGMSDHRHGHVPHVLLLLKYLDDWRASHGGLHPSSFKEKNELKAMIMDRMRMNVPGGSEENYLEAAAAVFKNVREAEVSSDTEAVLTDSRCTNPGADSENFWIIANAIREFRERTNQGAGLLPLSGGFPDMKAESSTYVELQDMYRSRARRDTSLVLENVEATLTKLGRDPKSITFDEVSLFTKHSNFIRRINYRPISSEYSLPADDHHKKVVTDALKSWDGRDSLIHDYIAIRALQEYCTKEGKMPAVEDKEFESSLVIVTAYAENYLKSLKYAGSVSERTLGMLREVTRAGGTELHVIASLAGGLVAQEIVKVITQQYVPVNNTVIFDGIRSRSSVFEF